MADKRLSMFPYTASLEVVVEFDLSLTTIIFCLIESQLSIIYFESCESNVIGKDDSYSFENNILADIYDENFYCRYWEKKEE